jgi:hypothetical protein
MNKKTIIIFFTIGISIFTGCSTNNRPINNAEWLIGTWVTKTPDGDLFETWQKLNEAEYFGKSYFLNNGDTMLFETVQLLEKENKLFYIVSGKTKPGEAPVSFESISIAKEQFVFENKAHDFPQRISYVKIGTDSLVAEISGSINGKEKSELFPMKKMK